MIDLTSTQVNHVTKNPPPNSYHPEGGLMSICYIVGKCMLIMFLGVQSQMVFDQNTFLIKTMILIKQLTNGF